MHERNQGTLHVIFFVIASILTTACASDSRQLDKVVAFEEVPGPAFEHRWDETVHPFSGAAVIDVDGDGKLEVFVGGSNNQADALLSYQDGGLKNVIAQTGLSSLSATYGSASIDIDNDADIDLIVARENGLYLYVNNLGKFTARRIPLNLAEDAVVFGIAISDIDHDGDADLYLSVFVDFAAFQSGVFNDPKHAKPNIMLLNNGDLSFTDITESSGTSGKQNSFLSVFTDLDKDGWQDLVVSQNTGEVEIFRNNQNRTFTAIPSNSGYGFWMGLAVGDIDNDGDQDLFFSNVGSSIPEFLTRGDIQEDQRHNLEWLLLRNEGDFTFTEITEEFGISGEGFAWGAIFEDLNLDGRLDLLVAQNYIKWPIHKLFKLSGRSYLQTDQGGKFEHVEALGLENSYYGQSPISVDLNNDNKLDLLWLNMNGPVRAFLNRSSGKVFQVKVQEQASLLGTRVHIVTNAGTSYTKEVMTSTGMLTDQSPNLVFGLKDAEKVKQVIISRPDGSRQIIESPDDSMTLSANN
ncbi:MAG: CRTAC1 family protein [Oleiphilus sp.]